MKQLQTELQKRIINKEIDCCPHCGSNSGFYCKEFVSGKTEWRYNYDGSDADNTEAYDHLKIREGKIAYCQDCNKKILTKK